MISGFSHEGNVSAASISTPVLARKGALDDAAHLWIEGEGDHGPLAPHLEESAVALEYHAGVDSPSNADLGSHVLLELLPEVEDPHRPLLEELHEFYLILAHAVEPVSSGAVRAGAVELGHGPVGLEEQSLEPLDFPLLRIDLIRDEVILTEGNLRLRVIHRAEYVDVDPLARAAEAADERTFLSAQDEAAVRLHVTEDAGVLEADIIDREEERLFGERSLDGAARADRAFSRPLHSLDDLDRAVARDEGGLDAARHDDIAAREKAIAGEHRPGDLDETGEAHVPRLRTEVAFHGEPLAIVYDYLAIALAELGNISERRTAQLILGQRGLPEFLVANPGLNSGFMIPQYVAASVVSQNKMYCYAASSDSIVSSNGQEDHVSMGATSAIKLNKIMDNLDIILSIELMNAAQAMEFRRPLRSSPLIEKVIKDYRKEVPFVDEDIVMYKEIRKTVSFLNRLQVDAL
jgi:hypothetical protein